MADNEIIEKLKKYTHENPKEEKDVVYLIVQIGKIIERNDDAQNFPVLWFYRNWVVHYQLTRRAADGRMELLDKLNVAIGSVITGKNNEILQRLEEAISLKSLHKEIASFFQSYNLEKQGVDYLEWFKKFDALLISILVDLPLIPPPDGGYAFIEFRFKRSNADASDAEFEVKMPNNKSIGGRVVVKVTGKLRTYK